MDFGLEKFKKSQLGRQIGAIIEDPHNVAEMVVFCRHQIPAVEAVGKALRKLGPEVTEDQVKKTIGRWVREILERKGWTVWKIGRVTPGNLFSTGMIYRPKASSPTKPAASGEAGPALSPAERAAAWRKGVEDLPDSEPLSDAAISRESIYGDRG